MSAIPPVIVEDWKPVGRNTLLGFCRVRLAERNDPARRGGAHVKTASSGQHQRASLGSGATGCR